MHARAGAGSISGSCNRPIIFMWSLDDGAEFGDDAGHVDAAGLEVAAARVEHGLQFLDQEGHVAALAEHGAT